MLCAAGPNSTSKVSLKVITNHRFGQKKYTTYLIPDASLGELDQEPVASLIYKLICYAKTYTYIKEPNLTLGLVH